LTLWGVIPAEIAGFDFNAICLPFNRNGCGVIGDEKSLKAEIDREIEKAKIRKVEFEQECEADRLLRRTDPEDWKRRFFANVRAAEASSSA
jgi:hypothetical protein